MRKALSAIAIVAAAFGCAGGEEKAAAPSSGAYVLDAGLSSLNAVAMKNESVPVTLRFPKLGGSLALEPKLEARLSVDVAALSTGNPERDANIRDNFFEAGQAAFKDAAFKLKELDGGLPALKEGESWPVKATGELSLHGLTLALSGPLTISRQTDGYSAAFKDTWTINIKEAGMLDRLEILNQKCPQPHRVGWDVKLSGNLVFRKKV